MSESKLLTALLIDKQMHPLLQADASTLFTTHKDVWEFVKDYHSKNGSVPPVELVTDRFSDFVVESGVGSTKYHLEELRQEHLDRELRGALRSAANLVQQGKNQDALASLSQSIRDINKDIGVVKGVNAVDSDSALAHIQQLADNKALASGVRTGLRGLDICLPGGIKGGQFGVIMAYPGIGKSYLTLYLLAQAWLQGYTPMLISLEMDEDEVRNRLYAILGKMRWSVRKLDEGNVDIDEFAEWHLKTFEGKHPFYIITTETLGTEVTPNVIRAQMDQYKPDIVALDYMQLTSPNGGDTGNETLNMKQLSRELKLLAGAERIPVIAISSATPTDATDMSTPPTLGQVAWSKQIAYDANWILSLGREPNDDIVQVVGRKNRQGMLPDFLLRVDFDKGQFTYKDFDDL